jgi:hypothetical protein
MTIVPYEAKPASPVAEYGRARSRKRPRFLAANENDGDSIGSL